MQNAWRVAKAVQALGEHVRCDCPTLKRQEVLMAYQASVGLQERGFVSRNESKFGNSTTAVADAGIL